MSSPLPTAVAPQGAGLDLVWPCGRFKQYTVLSFTQTLQGGAWAPDETALASAIILARTTLPPKLPAAPCSIIVRLP